ncbi:MAG: aldehyde dehydrogenase family protein, partial [Rubrivivax sp.]|nr:aldehyde dehydrogenase family protein [Rubrivivax sp.]
MHDIGFDTTPILVGGRWQRCASGRTLTLVNPSHGTPLAEIARGEAADVDAAVAAAQAALDGEWGRLSA